MENQGLVHAYYGDGKGKTTAAMGLALRAVGRGFQVVVAQFLKDGTSGECNVLKQLPGVVVMAANPSGKFSFQMTAAEKTDTARELQILLEKAFFQAQTAKVLVLDEVLSAVACGFLEEDTVALLLRARPPQLEIVMTGHALSPSLEKMTDYISYVQKRRHPYDRGILARVGIEQ